MELKYHGIKGTLKIGEISNHKILVLENDIALINLTHLDLDLLLDKNEVVVKDKKVAEWLIKHEIVEKIRLSSKLKTFILKLKINIDDNIPIYQYGDFNVFIKNVKTEDENLVIMYEINHRFSRCINKSAFMTGSPYQDKFKPEDKEIAIWLEENNIAHFEDDTNDYMILN